MKKLFLMAAAITTVMSSCQKSDVEATTDSQKAISFSTYSANATKAIEEVGDTELQYNGFSIWVRETTSEPSYDKFLEGEAVSYDGSLDWNATQTYYYPTGSTLDFLAIGNQKSTDSGENDGATSVVTVNNLAALDAITYEFTATASPATQQDLVWAYAASKDEGAVTLTFKHALSRLSASVVANTEDTNLKLVIESITFTDIKPKGTFTPSTGACDASETTADNELGLITTPEFQGAETPSEIVATSTTGALMIIPQDATTIEIKGYWEDEDSRKIEDFSSAAKVVDLASSGYTWDGNTSYTYVLTITPNVNAVSFSVQDMTDWGTGENVTHTVSDGD